MNQKIIFFAFILFLFISCKDDIHKSNYPIAKISLKDFDKFYEIEGEEISFDNNTELSSIYTIDSILVVSTSSKHKEFLKIYNLKTMSHLGDIGVRGEAPGEWLNVYVTDFRKENDKYLLTISDRFKGYVKIVDILPSLNNVDSPVYKEEFNYNASTFPISFAIYHEGYLFGNYAYEDDTNAIFKRLNLETLETKMIEVFPKIKNSQDIPSPILSKFYSGNLLLNFKKNRIVQASPIFNRINIIDTELNVIKSIVDESNWKDNYIDANQFDLYTGDYNLINNGHRNMCVSNEFIFANYVQTYEDRMKKEHIPIEDQSSLFKVFDWDGNPIVLLSLNRCSPYSTFYNESNKTLFVNDVKNQKIMRFDLNKIL
jgi:hypothetical protein